MRPGITRSPDLGFLGAHLADAVEPFREAGGEAHRHVLDDDDARRIGGEGRQDAGQRLDAAGRGADGDDAIGGFLQRGGDRLDRRSRAAPRKAGHVRIRRRLYAPADVVEHERQTIHQSENRLGHHVDGAGLERFEAYALARLGQRRNDHRRRRHQRHEAFQEGHAVHFRHLDVERDDVGSQFHQEVASAVRVGRLPDHFDFGVLRQPDRQDLPHHGGVVDDQHADGDLCGGKLMRALR